MSEAAVAGILAAVAMLGLAALASGAQTALSRITLAGALKLADDGRRGAQRLLREVEGTPGAAGRIALLGLGAQAVGVALATWLLLGALGGGWGVAVAAAGSAVLLYVGAEVAPKTVALQHTERAALLLVPLAGALARPLAPLASALIRVGNLVAPGRGLAQGPFITEEQLREMIDAAESDEVIESRERQMIHSIFELGDTVVREIMVPRPDMVTVSVDDPLDRVLGVVLEAGHSRIPVYKTDRDEIVGVLYAKDVLRRLHRDGGLDGPWEDLLRPAHFVPELKLVDGLLREMQTRRIHLAVVVDEYGATAGLVTIEDILEEIVGEIEDEYDREEQLVEALGEERWRVDARLPVDELAELVGGADLPDEEWDTVGGLLFGLLGHVAVPGEQVAVDGLRLTAERVKGRRIAKVLVERVPVHAEGQEPQ